MSLAPVLCVFGTGSDVGKSWISAGLCRLFAQDGVRVAPYKAQNMSNNAGVTAEGLEMGRAQIVQAQAAGVVPHVDMNPLLLKPNTETGAQVVALGKVVGSMSAQDYFLSDMSERHALVQGALDRLRAQYELVVVEGAGSCAEVNLRQRDLVNMPIAHHAQAPVVLVADIHKGGVFGQIVGTLACMSPEDRARVAGFIINRFRGDPTLFEDGVAWLEAETGLPVFGVVPWTRDVQIELEDGLAEDTVVDPPPPRDRDRFHAAVICLPHMANFTDFDALERHGVAVHYLGTPRDLGPYDLVILPGTKNTLGDLRWLIHQGWAPRIVAFGGQVMGLCGGYQMLGTLVTDPGGVDGAGGRVTGLGLLPVRTEMTPQKSTQQVRGRLGDLPIEGYEIHMGQTSGRVDPLLRLDGPEGSRPEGARFGRAMGTYVHGIFDAPGAVAALLGPLRPDLSLPTLPSHARWREEQFDLLAAHLRGCLDVAALRGAVGL